MFTEIPNGSSTGVRVTVLGSVLGVSIFVSMVMVIAFFCRLKKGTYTKLIILLSIGDRKTVLAL